MKKYMLLLLFLMIFIFYFPLIAGAEVLIDIDFDQGGPSSEIAGGSYTGTGYTGLVKLALSGGATMDHLNTGGWNNSGAAKFFPPTTGDSYCGFGAPTVTGNRSQLNIRFLVNYGSDFAARISDQIKHAIIKKTSEPRTWFNIDTVSNWGGPQYTLSHYGTVAFGHGGTYPCGEYPCPDDLGSPGLTPGTWPNSFCAHCNDDFDRCSNNNIFHIADHLNEWICIEMEAKSTGETAIYIWTEDGAYNGMYLSTDTGNPAQITGIDKICGYFNGAMAASSNNYYLVDEIAVADEYIGPPTGFGSSAPSGDEISGDVIFESDFEDGSFSEWMGTRGDLSVVNVNPQSGNYCAKATLTSGTHSDNYCDYYFGDHSSVGGEKVEEVYLTLYSKFDPGYVWPSSTQKIAILNLTDGVSTQRRYQVMIVVNSDGRYFVEHSFIDDWQFFGLSQNEGDPSSVRDGEWDKLKLYTKLNTPGSDDGIVKLWVNDELKLSYDNVNIRESNSFGMNKLIMSSYSQSSSGSNGFQYYDNFLLSTTDSDSDGSVAAPEPPFLRVVSD